MKYKIIAIILALGVFSSCDKDESSRASYHKEVISYSFKSADNPVLSEDNDGTVDMETKILTATLPYGVDVSALIPSFELSEGAKVLSPTGTQDFTNPVEYKIQAADESVFIYTCMAELSTGSGKFMKTFIVDGNEGVINDADNIVVARMNYGNFWNNVTPTITVADGATVSPESGVIQDFTNPVEYTVTSADGYVKKYSVIVGGTAIEGKFADGHDGYTIVNYWPDNIATGWAVNYSTAFIDGNPTADRNIYSHEQKDPSTGILISAVTNLATPDNSVGDKWEGRFDSEEDITFEGQYLLWSKAVYADRWASSPKETFEVEKAIFVNDLGMEFDITKQTAGEYLPIALIYVFEAEYKLKVWYNQVNLSTGVKVKSYREMKFSSFYDIEILRIYQGVTETRECVRMDIAIWNENNGWIYGDGNYDVGATSYGYQEYLAEDAGRGWLVVDNNNISGVDREFRIDWFARP